MSISINELVAEAESKEEYPDTKALRHSLEIGLQRLKIVELITQNSKQIFQNLKIVELIAENSKQTLSELLTPEQVDYTTDQVARCLRDCDIILRYITYAFIVNDISELEDRCLNGLKETYIALDVPLNRTIQTINLMKVLTINLIDKTNDHHLISSSLSNELESYFDRVISSLDNNINLNQDLTLLKKIKGLNPLYYDEMLEKVTIPTSSAKKNELDIWQRGNRMIVFASGCSFVGGMFGQLPGALIGAIAGAIYGSILKLETDSPN
jgi:hypothetical protein